MQAGVDDKSVVFLFNDTQASEHHMRYRIIPSLNAFDLILS